MRAGRGAVVDRAEAWHGAIAAATANENRTARHLPICTKGFADLPEQGSDGWRCSCRGVFSLAIKRPSTIGMECSSPTASCMRANPYSTHTNTKTKKKKKKMSQKKKKKKKKKKEKSCVREEGHWRIMDDRLLCDISASCDAPPSTLGRAWERKVKQKRM